jgi:acyl-CoA synthetase (AMP-forming)/AMP-acid ligase II
MDTLLDLIANHERLGRREALSWFNGFRTWKLSYRDTYDAIGRFASFLDSAGIRKGDRVLIWGENRPEWDASHSGPFHGQRACYAACFNTRSRCLFPSLHSPYHHRHREPERSRATGDLRGQSYESPGYSCDFRRTPPGTGAGVSLLR